MNTTEPIERLKELMDALPETYSPSEIKELKDLFSQCKMTLDNIYNSGMEELKRNTAMLYMNLSDLNKAIYIMEYGRTEKFRHHEFSEAVKGLQSEMIALKAILFSFNKINQAPNQGNYIPI